MAEREGSSRLFRQPRWLRPRQAGYSRFVIATLCAGVAALPFLVPAGPGNTSPVDIFLVSAILVVLIDAAARRQRLRFPYLAGAGLMMVAGAIAAIAAGHVTFTLPLLQDLLLLVWCAVLATACREPRVMSAVTRTWVITGMTAAALMLVGRFGGIGLLAGQTARDGTRAAFTFTDPNMAGNYFVITFLLTVATKRPRAARWRLLGEAMLLIAIVATGSNGAILGIGIGVFLLACGRAARRYGAMGGVAAALALTILVGAPAFLVVKSGALNAATAKAGTSIPLLHDSIGRSTDSEDSRGTLIAETMQLFWKSSGIGIGPGGTKNALAAERAPYVKIAHDDYIAIALERGILGAVGLAILVATLLMYAARGVTRRGPPWADVIPRPGALLIVSVLILISAIYYQVMHFRHVWAMFAIIAALGMHRTPPLAPAAEQPDELRDEHDLAGSVPAGH